MADLTSLHDAIVARLSADMSGVTVAAYPVLQRKIDIPSVLVDMDDIEMADFGDEALGLRLRFVAYCISDPALAGAEITARNLAVTTAVCIFKEEDFGEDVHETTKLIHVGRDDFNPDLQSYMVWSVEFTLGIEVDAGAYSVNPAAGVPVSQVTLGDLNTIDIEHVLADGLEPESKDKVILPQTPKG